MMEERDRLQEAIKTAKVKRQEAECEIVQLAAQMMAIAAYEAALKGKGVLKDSAGRRSKKREALLSIIAQHPDGITRRDLLTKMQAHGDQAAAMSISNALTALKKPDVLCRRARRTRWDRSSWG